MQNKNLNSDKKSKLGFKIFTIVALVLFAIPAILSASVLISGSSVELHSSFLVILITFIGIEILWFSTLILGWKGENKESTLD